MDYTFRLFVVSYSVWFYSASSKAFLIASTSNFFCSFVMCIFESNSKHGIRSIEFLFISFVLL